MAKDRIVELNLVVRLDRHLDDDLELLVRDYLQSEGLLDVSELTRVGMTGTIDLPRIWLPSATDAELEALEVEASMIEPSSPLPLPTSPALPTSQRVPGVPVAWIPPWRKKK